MAARWIPRLLMVVATTHILLALTASPLRAMMSDGLVNSIGSSAERSDATWFLFAGVALMMLGELSRQHVRQSGRLPNHLAAFLVAAGLVLVVVQPQTGAWALIGLGVWALSSRKSTRLG